MILANEISNNVANTRPECAQQRAENLKILDNVNNVLELCVGPSLETYENKYSEFNISVTGNDIDPRWKWFYKKGSWVIGDAIGVAKRYKDNFDAVVFAPPLSEECSGNRSDSLRIDQVKPSYFDFISKVKINSGIGVLVLPARSLATSRDKKIFYKLRSRLYQEYKNIEISEITAGRREIRKYVDVYFYKDSNS